VNLQPVHIVGVSGNVIWWWTISDVCNTCTTICDQTGHKAHNF